MVKNMYRVIIAYICSVILLSGCTSPLEKSVLELLTSKQLDKVAKKDKSFLATYSIVEEKWNYISTPEDSARWRGITYNRLHNYLNTINSSEINTPLYSKLRRDWENSYKDYNNQVDSLISFWSDYLISNSPDSLASITFAGIELDKFRNDKKEIDTLVKVKIKIKALRTDIDSLSLLYGFAKDNTPVAYYFPFNGKLNSIKHKRRISDSITIKVYPYLLPDIKRSLVSSDSLLKFIPAIHSVYSNGKCYNTDSLKKDLPEAALKLIEHLTYDNDPMFDASYYREKLIIEKIDPRFVPQSAYIKINSEQYYRALDTLVFNYVNYRGEK